MVRAEVCEGLVTEGSEAGVVGEDSMEGGE